MKAITKILALVVIVTAILLVVSLVISISGHSAVLPPILKDKNTWWFLWLSTGVLLLNNGVLLRSKYFLPMAGFGLLSMVGVLFKILHWKGGAWLLTIGLAGILITYLIHFFKKPGSTSALDRMKLYWVILLIAGNFMSSFLTLFLIPVLLFLSLYLGIVYFRNADQLVNHSPHT